MHCIDHHDDLDSMDMRLDNALHGHNNIDRYISLWADLLHACRSSTHVRVRDDRIQLYLPVLPGSSELGLGMVLVSLDSHKHINHDLPIRFLTVVLASLMMFNTAPSSGTWPFSYQNSLLMVREFRLTRLQIFFFLEYSKDFIQIHLIHYFECSLISARLHWLGTVFTSISHNFLPGPTLHVSDRDVRHCLMNIHDTHIWVPFPPRFELFGFQALYRGTVKHCG